ncbi:MAG: RNA polymerase sigma factor [Chloroflexi bacterium]|nr:RNA polymerase sigma factor [Chloroflexota bacterium]MCI0575823.1 RNA polymerase sigma factor [Chloroflexota bacterium]MCI0646550.1 RNA polymerase sigma factor [Chloroflexota bacterium]MCI0726352.1 RNA polymerase sigma factor [Chloroflexota bacterium]
MQSQLFQRAENGDSQAQGELFRQHYPASYRLAYSLLSHREDAEEVAQDALAYALTNLARFDPARGAFTTWLYTITVSRCRNKRRRRQLAEVPLFNWLAGETRPAGAPSNPQEQMLEQLEAQAAVHLAIRQLPARQQEAVILRYFHDLNYGEIGQIVGCSASTAQSRVWLGQKRLYRLLANALGEGVWR